MEGSDGLNKKLNTFLFTYRITALSTTSVLPAELLMNRKLNSELNIIKPGAEFTKEYFHLRLLVSLKRVTKFGFKILALVINGYWEQFCIVQVSYLTTH